MPRKTPRVVVPFHLGLKGGEVITKKKIKPSKIHRQSILEKLDPEFRPPKVNRRKTFDKKKGK